MSGVLTQQELDTVLNDSDLQLNKNEKKALSICLVKNGNYSFAMSNTGVHRNKIKKLRDEVLAHWRTMIAKQQLPINQRDI